MNTNDAILPRVIVNSLPKAGTNLLTRLLSMMPGMQNSGLHLGHSTLKGTTPADATCVPVGVDFPMDVALPRLAMPLGRLKPGAFASGHIPYSAVFSSYLQVTGFKVVMIVRHPAAVVLSHARYISESAGHPLHAHYTGLTEAEQIQTSITGVKLPEIALASIAKRFESITRWAADPNVHLVTFENLVGVEGGGSLEKQQTSIYELANFLGIKLAEKSVGQMVSHLFGQSSTFRAGQIDAWKKVLHSEHLASLGAQIGRRYSHLGYVVGEDAPAEKTVPKTEASSPESPAPDAKLIYLVSQPRAGSTLLQRVLSGHTDIHTLAEPWVMLHPVYALKKEGVHAAYNAMLAHDALDDFMEALPNGRKDYVKAIRAMASSLYRSALATHEARYFLDKTPRYYNILPELDEVFPDARIIVLLRNPLAILSSVLKTWVGKNWQRLQLHREDLLRAPALLVEGLKKLNDRAIVVRYEAFVASPEASLVKLCTALEIPFEAHMLDYSLSKPPQGRMGDPVGVKSHSRPVKDSLEKWKETFSYPTYRLLAEIMLTLVGRDVVERMGYNYDALYDALLAIPLSTTHVAQEEIVDMISSLRIGPAEVEQISPLIEAYLKPAPAAQSHTLDEVAV